MCRPGHRHVIGGELKKHGVIGPIRGGNAVTHRCKADWWRLQGLSLALLIGLAPAGAWAAGTAFGVDTAEVSDPGNCKVEGWTSRANNMDWLATVNPACVVQAFTPTELSVQIQRSRDGGDWATTVAPKLKAKLVPTAIGSFGFAFAAGSAYDLTTDELSTVFAYVPATLRLSEIVRININAGWQLDKTTDRNFATYGIGFDWKLTETVILTGETFGLLGSSDSPYETRPRYQAGLRWRPVDRFSVDLIYGHNINGENADWITLGSTIRFPPN